MHRLSVARALAARTQMPQEYIMRRYKDKAAQVTSISFACQRLAFTLILTLTLALSTTSHNHALTRTLIGAGDERDAHRHECRHRDRPLALW
jgi:hypothetical protein